MGRPTKGAARKRKARAIESEESKRIRLTECKERIEARRRDEETSTEREYRLSQMRAYTNARLARETADERVHRLNLIQSRLENESIEEKNCRMSLIHMRLRDEMPEDREKRIGIIHKRLRSETPEARDHRIGLIKKRLRNETTEARQYRVGVIRERLRNETPEDRKHRIGLIRERLKNESREAREHRYNVIRTRLSNESAKERSRRRSLVRERRHKVIQNETADERIERLSDIRARATYRRNENVNDEEEYKVDINRFADMPCTVCEKLLYPPQRVTLRTHLLSVPLPKELTEFNTIITCLRCSKHLKSRKIPSQAYWNNMKVAHVPEELASLSDIEQQMLCRVIPFMKIIKVQNRYSHDWCKGQVTLFARDVVEIAEQLPLRLNQTGFVIVIERLDNLDRCRQFEINVGKLQSALDWLLKYNHLYKDVRPCFTEITSNIAEIVHIPEAVHNVQDVMKVPNDIIAVDEYSNYVIVGSYKKILHGSFHQGSDRFSNDSRGKQCTGIAAVACAALRFNDPRTWCSSDVDYVLLIGDKYYRDCMAARTDPHPTEIGKEYLAVTELLPHVLFHGQTISITVKHELSIHGHIDIDSSNNGFPNLKNALRIFFTNNTCGILTANFIAVAVSCNTQTDTPSYWYFDSHARGKKGFKAPRGGVACCMKIDSFNELHTTLRRNMYAKTGDINTLNTYSLTCLSIAIDYGDKSLEITNARAAPQVNNVPRITEVSNDDNAVDKNNYVNVGDNVEILRGSFHQGCDQFSNDSRGKQCTGIAAVACAALCLNDPCTWCSNDIDKILVVGDNYYRDCIAARTHPNPTEVGVEYLTVNELLPHVLFNGQTISITVKHESSINGHIDIDNSSNGFPNLKNALHIFFTNNTCGILTANFTAVAVSCNTQTDTPSYWYFDSHSRGAKGYKAPRRGTACCMKIDNIDKLHAILRRNVYAKTGDSNTLNVYSLTSLLVIAEERGKSLQFVNEPKIAHPNVANPEENNVIFETNMLRPIDEDFPNLDSVVAIRNDDDNTEERGPVRLVDVQRKTAPPLNLDRERRMEELGWFFLFPDGKNGFGEHREVAITPLDYFQARIMGNDRRFQRTDYLFFALSVVEYFRAKASISVACRMKQGDHTPQGLVDNMHLMMRNIRGSASYWRRCCSELIAMVRSLGPPAWFATFSCNDLNWPDMLQALLLADGQTTTNVASLSFVQRMDLVQKYPVVIARQFTLRVNALMRYIKRSKCLGSDVVDFWYRIEFQNRGSPHLHMLIWCKNVPDFFTEEGRKLIDEVVTCSLEPTDTHLSEIVRRVQTHKHSRTCYKDRNNRSCRFGFPRPISNTTVCLGPDDTLANNGRFCVLRRSASEVMINNYNPKLLTVWEANLDIQPCGSVTAVSYYIAKYASKCEPHETGNAVKEAITRAKRRGGAVWNQLFSVSMAILSQRLVSAAECAYRLCHLPLKLCSRKTVFINSCRPEERFRILRFDADDTSIFNNIFDRYIERPNSLEDISLAEFAVRYESISGKLWTEEEGDAELREDEEQSSKFIRLKNGSRMRIRNKPAVLRHRYYTLNSDREGYFYNLIVCHIPFRSEHALLLENESAEECFLRRKHELRPLNGNTSAEEFAYAEQAIQAALAQAVALNAIYEQRENGGEEDHDVIYADEHVYIAPVDMQDEQHEEQDRMPDDVFINTVRNLNIQQRDLFKRVSTVIENDIKNNEEISDQQLFLFITGGAGSGKSFVLKLIVEHVKRCYAPTVDALMKPSFIEVASLTGVAARQIHGKTLHSIFSLPIEKSNTKSYQRMSGQRLEQERRKWRYIKWLIIDEISMISYEILRVIHLRLQEFKNEKDKLFGGINILLFGDIMQLPPVKGHWCFDQPSWCESEINLWHQFSFCELTINMRQKDDVEFIDLLNNLRFGEVTAAQLEILCERRRIPLTGKFDDGEAVRIFPTVKLVDEYNSKMTDTMAQLHMVYDIEAVDESREAATYGKRPPENVIPANVNDCGGLLQSIRLAEGSRVMLRRNISISDGLVNGAMGIVQKFNWPALRRGQLEAGELPESVMIKFDDNSIGNRFKDSHGNVAITPVTATFQATKGYGDVERRMLPLILSWAVTVHKLQGTTLSRAVIDLGNKNFAKGQIYVALSRVRSIDGFALSDLAPNKVLNKPHDAKAFAEMQRLRGLPQ